MRALLTAALIAALAAPLGADELTYQDGSKASDQLTEIADGEATFAKKGAVSLGLLKTIELAKVVIKPSPCVFTLRGGDVLRGAIATNEEGGTALAIKNELLGGAVNVPSRAVALIDFGGEEKIPEDAGGRQDALYVRGKNGKIQTLFGAMESLTDSRVKFFWKIGGATKTFKLSKVRALRFGGGSDVEDEVDEEQLQLRLRLTDGSVLTTRELTLDDQGLSLVHASGMTFEAKRAAIASIGVTSDWVLYLANLEPRVVSDRLYQHGLATVDFPAYRTNQTIYGTPLAKPFTNGIGTYGTTKLSYDLKGRYKTFVATVMLSLPPGTKVEDSQGSVVFRIYGDGRKLYDSGVVTAGSKPKQVKVDIEEVRELTLEVDRGEDWGVGDAGTWADPKVHK